MAKAVRMDDMAGFSPTGFGGDFEACCCVRLEGRPEGAIDDIWFKAYDTSIGENASDRALAEAGCAYNCEVMYRPDGSLYGPAVVPGRGCRDRGEAESYLAGVYEGIRDGSVDVPLEG